MIKCTGHIKHIRFVNPNNNFIVATFVLDKTNKVININGFLPDAISSVSYTLIGEFKIHEKYGEQFVFERYKAVEQNYTNGIIDFISSPLFPGIGFATAKKIVTILGDDCLKYILNNNDCLYSVEGLTDKSRKSIIKSINDNSNLIKLLSFFMEKNIPLTNVVKIYDIYGKKSIDIISMDTYKLVKDIPGFTFEDADSIALRVSGPLINQNRLSAAIIYVIEKYTAQFGSTYITKKFLVDKLSFMSIYYENQLDLVLNKLFIDKKIFIYNEKIFIYKMYLAEKEIAKILLEINSNSVVYESESKINNEVIKLEKTNGIKYGDDQIEAIKQFVNSSCMILTGGPGTGKTTVVKAMIDIYTILNTNSHIALVAPTGRAAKRLNDLTGLKSTTIHRLLGLDIKTNTFYHNENNPISENIIIIDETSMVDTMLLYNLLKACRYVNKILFIGDHNQLPSVGNGNMLFDLLETNLDKTILNIIYRQDDNSGIIPFSYKILNNEVVSTNDFKSYSDLYFYECSGKIVINNILKVVTSAINQGYTANDIQVLAPMYRGTCGINSLNYALQSVLNPKTKNSIEYVYGNKIYRVGDKIILLKNLPENDVYNGDVGYLKEIKYKDNLKFKKDTFIISFDNVDIFFTVNDFNLINHAYCISVHKSQGSEFKIVIMTVLEEHSLMLKRKLFYTGITRARDLLFIIGQETALQKAISNTKRDSRNTGFVERFQEELKLFGMKW